MVRLGMTTGPVRSKSMSISIDQLSKIIEFHTIIVHNYSSVDFIFIFLYVAGHFDKLKTLLKAYRSVFLKTVAD